jgi:hypothetical protein
MQREARFELPRDVSLAASVDAADANEQAASFRNRLTPP